MNSPDPSVDADATHIVILKQIDEMVYRFEQSVVTAAALIMTVTVTLDIIFRSFSVEESQLAQKLAGILGAFGIGPSPNLDAALQGFVAPGILVLCAFGMGWALYDAKCRRNSLEKSTGKALISGLISFLGCWGLIQIVVHTESRWVCLGIVVICASSYVLWAIKQGMRANPLIALCLAIPLGTWAVKVPEAYIWSQELSLILLSWLAFLGASMATRDKKHIAVDALKKIIPTKLKPVTRALGLLATTLFCLYLTVLAYEHVFGEMGDFISGEIRPATGFPAWTITFPIILGFAVMGMRFAAITIDAFIHPGVPEEGLSH